MKSGDQATFKAMTMAGLAFATVLSAAALMVAVNRPASAEGPDTPTSTTAAAEDDGRPLGVIEVVASDFAFTPSEISVEAAGTYEVVLDNQGVVLHDLTIGTTKVVAEPGQKASAMVRLSEGTTEIFCSVPGHKDAGMVGHMTVGTTTETTVADDHGAAPAEGPSVAADENAPAYELRDPRVPARGEGPGVTLVPGGAANGGDLIEVELVIEEKLMTVAEGYQQKVWTFGGQLPGPVIRTRVGDTVRVRLVNPPEAELSHSIDFHASQVAWNDEMTSIAPGEEKIYEFTTDYAGVWMYHCGTGPVLHHIANGMYGMVITEPAEGLEPLANEFFFVQSEWYLGEQGEVSSLAKADKGAPSPDLVMFNGIAKQYLDNPVQIPTGEKVRVFVLNVGPSIDSSFHVVGTIFDTVIKEGYTLLRGNPGNYGSQAVDLSPAQGAIIEMKAMEDGLYPIVTHAFNFPGRGAIGLFQAGDGDPLN
jgi:nitrite reductase (NO-forming)